MASLSEQTIQDLNDVTSVTCDVTKLSQASKCRVDVCMIVVGRQMLQVPVFHWTVDV